jgi:hypothetical protein
MVLARRTRRLLLKGRAGKRQKVMRGNHQRERGRGRRGRGGQ